MNVYKYILLLIIFSLAVLSIIHYISPYSIEGFLGIEWDGSLYILWNIFRVIMNFIVGVSFALSLIGTIIIVIVQNMYLERRKYIRWIIVISLFGILLLPYIVVMEDRETKYRWFRLSFYFYTMIILVNLSWFIGTMLGDLGIIALAACRSIITSSI